MAKSEHDPESFPALAEGLIDKEITAKLGVSEDSFYEYLKRHSEFSESIKRDKAPVDFAVEGAARLGLSLRRPPLSPAGATRAPPLTMVCCAAPFLPAALASGGSSELCSFFSAILLTNGVFELIL